MKHRISRSSASLTSEQLKPSLLTKSAAILGLQKEVPSTFLYISLCTFQIQILFVSIRVALTYFPSNKSQIGTIFRIMSNFVNFDDMFSYNRPNPLILLTLSVILLCFLIMIFYMTLTLRRLYSSDPDHPRVLASKFWIFLLKAHGTIFSLPITNLTIRIWFELYVSPLAHTNRANDTHRILFPLATIVFALNCILSILPAIFLTSVLPSKDVHSTKLWHVKASVICFTILFALMYRFLPNTSACSWILMMLSLVFNLGKYKLYCLFLPKYDYPALRLEACILENTALVAFLIPFCQLLNALFDLNITFGSLMIIYLICSSGTVIRDNSFLERNIKDILFNPKNESNPFKAMHKLYALKYLRYHMKRPSENQKKVDIWYLYFCKMSTSNQGMQSLDLDNKHNRNAFKRTLLETLLGRFPDNDLIRLLLAQLYAKSLKLFPLSIKTLAKLKSRAAPIQISAQMIHYQIERQFVAQSKISHEGMCIFDYIKANAREAKLKEKIGHEVQCLIKFWNEYSKNSPDAFTLQELSEEIHRYKTDIREEWTSTDNQNSKDSYPFSLIYGYYLSVVNNTPKEGHALINRCNKLLMQHRKQSYNHQGELASLWKGDNTFSVVVRTDQDWTGVISDCSKSCERILGFSRDYLVGSNIGVMMTPYLADRHNSFIQDYIKTGHSNLIDTMRTVYVKNRRGFVQKCSMLMSIHPSINNEVLLIGLFRVIEDTKQYILLTPDGKIDSCTATIAKKLGLEGKETSISNICSSFMETNTAFNIIATGKSEQNSVMQGVGLTHITENESPQSHKLFTLRQGTEEDYTTPEEMSTSRTFIKSGLKRPPKMVAFREVVSVSNKSAAPMSKEEAERIYRECSTQGKRFKFNLYQTNRSPQSASQIFFFSCVVTLLRLKNDFMKIIEMTIPDKDEVDALEKAILKRNGSKKNLFGLNRDSKRQKTPELIPDSGQRLLLRNQDSPNSIFIQSPSTLAMYVKSMISNNNASDDESREVASQNNKWNKEIVRATGSTTTRQSFRNEKVYTIIKEVFQVKFFPRRQISFLILLITTFIITFVLIMSFNVVANQAVENSEDLVGVLNNASNRADSLVFTIRTTRVAFALQVGTLPISPSASIANLIKTYFQSFSLVQILKDSNDHLRSALIGIDPKLQPHFNNEDIRIYDIEPDLSKGTYQLQNTFTATTLVVDKLLQINQRFKETGDFALTDLMFVLKNSIDDLLVANLDTMSQIQTSIDRLIQRTVYIFDIEFMILLVMMVILVVIAGCFIYFGYRSELQLISRCVGLSPKNVKEVQETLRRFKQVLDSEDYSKFPSVYNSTKKASKTDVKEQNGQSINRSFKDLQTRRFQIRYWFRFLLFFFLNALHVGLFAISYDLIEAEIDNLKLLMNRLAVTQTTQIRISLTHAVFLTLLFDGKTATALNIPVETEFKSALKTFEGFSNNLVKVYQDKNHVIHSQAEMFLFGDACKQVSSSLQAGCLSLAKGSEKSSLISLINLDYSLLIDLYADYNATILTFAQTRRLAVKTLSGIGQVGVVLRDLFLSIAKAETGNFKNSTKTTKLITTSFLIIYPLATLITFVIFRRFIISHSIRYPERIKKILGLMPINVLVKDKVLRGVLMRITNSNLSSLMLEEIS